MTSSKLQKVEFHLFSKYELNFIFTYLFWVTPKSFPRKIHLRCDSQFRTRMNTWTQNSGSNPAPLNPTNPTTQTKNIAGFRIWVHFISDIPFFLLIITLYSAINSLSRSSTHPNSAIHPSRFRLYRIWPNCSSGCSHFPHSVFGILSFWLTIHSSPNSVGLSNPTPPFSKEDISIQRFSVRPTSNFYSIMLILSCFMLLLILGFCADFIMLFNFCFWMEFEMNLRTSAGNLCDVWFLGKNVILLSWIFLSYWRFQSF